MMKEDILCRSCMSNIQKYEDQYDAKLLEKFSFCTNIVVSENDELSNQFCFECVVKIESSYDYIKEALRIDLILKNRLKSKIKLSISEANSKENLVEDIPEKETEQFSFLGLLLSNTNVDICYDNSAFNTDNAKEVDDNQEPFDNNDLIFDTESQTKTKKCEKPDDTSKSPALKFLLLQNENNANSEFTQETFKKSSKRCEEIVSNVDGRGIKSKFNKVCEPCQKEFKVKHAYNKHMKKHTEQLTKCEQCNKEFQSVYKLQHHRYLCLKETFKVVCKHCGLKFRNQAKLTLHVTSKHSQERPYCCDVCSKQFKFKRILEQHMIVHSNIKPFLCETCGLGFTQANSLKEHKQTHSSETPYKCDLCEFRTKRMASVVRHKRQHTGDRPHQCSYCGRKYYVLFDLKQHIRKHTGDFQYNCPLCARKFINSTKRKEHMVRAHKIALGDIPRMNKNGETLLKEQNIPLVPEG